MFKNIIEHNSSASGKRHRHRDEDSLSNTSGDSGSESDSGSDSDNESFDEKTGGYANSAMYLIFCLFCIMIGWWLCEKKIITPYARTQ
tara:strand:+ start:189 stop:452 length:264 start_codon:yes stop_codon:yes gene_type:complete